MVGAAGVEPTITGSKPDALPLGYAPINHVQSGVSGSIIGQNAERNRLSSKNSNRTVFVTVKRPKHRL